MPAAASDAKPSGSKPVALGVGRSGLVRAALRRALEESRKSDRMTAEHEVRALLAERYAELVDRASDDVDAPAVLRAGEKLVELMDTLPIRAEGGTPGDGSGSDRGRVLSILDGPPQVDHAKDA